MHVLILFCYVSDRLQLNVDIFCHCCFMTETTAASARSSCHIHVGSIRWRSRSSNSLPVCWTWKTLLSCVSVSSLLWCIIQNAFLHYCKEIKKSTSVFLYVCPLIDGSLRRNIVKVVVEPRAAGERFCNKLCQCCDAVFHQQEDRLMEKLPSVCFYNNKTPKWSNGGNK